MQNKIIIMNKYKKVKILLMNKYKKLNSKYKKLNMIKK